MHREPPGAFQTDRKVIPVDGSASDRLACQSPYRESPAGALGCVDLVGAYSNRQDLLNDLVTASRVIKEASGGAPERESVQTPPSSPNVRPRLSERLTPEDIQTLVALFATGTTKAQLEERFGISRSSVKRILRQHRSMG